MQRVKLGLVCLSWLCLASAVSAQTAVDPFSDSGVAAVQNVSGGGVLDGTYFDIRHVIGDGVGYTNSYSQLGLFTPLWVSEDAFIAPNARLMITNSTQTGVSAGLVGRNYFGGIDRIIGAYGYFDTDQNSYNNRYNQVTVGAETLGAWWDLRANAYMVNGNSNNYLQALGVGGNPYYVGNNIAFAGQQLRDRALSGADAEFGMPLSPYTPWLRGYAGAYGYRTDTSNTIGYRGRIEAVVSNDLTLGVTVSQDPLWGTNVNGVIDFKFSGFNPTKYFPNLTTRDRMLNPVQRNWRIATHTYTNTVNVDAINPATNQPYFITHVNNTSAPGGNGTIENPYNHLVTSSQADIILVHLGNANSLANAVTGSAVLSNNQRLLGDGILSTVQLYAHYGTNTINGTYVLPQTSNSGIYPYVTNPNGNIVTLANNNEVAGLNLIGAAGSAITNTAAGSNNFNLHNLEIANNGGYGIGLTNASGSGIISNINVGVNDHANPLGLGNNVLGGISVSTAAPGLGLQMTNVNMNADATGAQAFGVSLLAANGYLNANLNNVSANGNNSATGNTVAGIQLGETGQSLAVNLNSVNASANAGVGVQVTGTGGSITLNGTDVAAIGNASDNLQMGTQANPITGAVINVSMTGSSFSNSTGGSGVVFSGSNSFGNLYLNSSVFGNAVDGLAIYATNGSQMNAYAETSLFTNNGRDAFHVEGDTGSNVNLIAGQINASGSGRNGLYYKLGQNSVLNATINNTNFNNSGNSAVYGLIDNFAFANLSFNKTTGANSGADGFYLNATNNSLANINITDGTFGYSGRLVGGSSAINIQSDNSAVNLVTNNTIPGQPANFTFAGNTRPDGSHANQAYGLTLNIKDGSNFNGTIQNGDLSYNLVNAVNANILSNSNAALTLFNTNGNFSGGDGFVATVNSANFVANLTNSNFNSSGGNGMNINVANSGVMTANLSASTVNSSGANGILSVVNGANSVANLNLTNGSDVNFNGTNGVSFQVNAGTVNLSDASSSISSNGKGNVNGSGVLGLVTNNGTANLNFLNTTINNNLDNGVFVTTNTGGNINAIFNLGTVSGNGLNSINPLVNHNDGIRLNMDNATNSSLQIINGAVISGNANDGVAISAVDFTTFNGTLLSSTIINNGVGANVQNGAGLEVDSNNSQVGLSIRGMTINNTNNPILANTQNYGLLTTSEGAFGNLTITGAYNNFSTNIIDAINSTASSGSTTSITFFDTTADNAKATGALFAVTGGSILNFTDYSFGATNVASISNNGGSGILATVDGTNSFANFNLDGVNLNLNGSTFGGQGFNGQATNGGHLDAFIANSNIIANTNQGIEITSANAGSLARFNVFNTIVTNNASEGLLVSATDQGTVYYRSINSQYNNNGTNGGLDGVKISAGNIAAPAGGTVISLFSGDTVDGNSGNGFSLNAANGGTITTSIQNTDISNNQLFGIAATATDANTQFNLLMTGTNTVSGNTLGSFGQFNLNGINQAVLQFSGTFSNPTGDGVHVDLENIVNAAVAIQGPGTIDNSGGNGISVNMVNDTNASVYVAGFTEINNSALDGILVNFNNVGSGAIQIQGPTNINNSGQNAVEINLTNGTNLINGLAYTDPITLLPTTIQVLTLTNNLLVLPSNTALNNLLPDPVTINLNQAVITPANALTVDSITANKSGNAGIVINASNSSIGALTTGATGGLNSFGTTNGTFITNNNITQSLKGDGLHLNYNTVDSNGAGTNGLDIASNTFSSNTQNGINIELFNSPITGATIINNIVSNNGTQQEPAGTLSFSLSDTDPGAKPATSTWSANNNSTAGITIASLSINLTPANQFWRADQNVNPNSIPAGFLPVKPTDVTVGLVTVDGVGIIPGNYPVVGLNNVALPLGGVPMDSQTLTLGFNSFTPLTNLGFILAHGDQSTVDNTVLAATTLAGATATITLPDGETFNGVFTAAGTLNITQALAGSAVSSAAKGEDGIRFNLNNSSLNNLNVANNTIANNGTVGSTAGNGIEFTGAAGHVVNSDLQNVAFTNNLITGNNGDGIRLVNPTTATNLISANFTGNTVNTSTGTGVNLSLASGDQSLNANFVSNNFDANAGGPGLNIVIGNNANLNGLFSHNTMNENGYSNTNTVPTFNTAAQGINIKMGTNGIVTSNFISNTINGNSSDGITIALGNGGQFNSSAFYGNTIGTNVAPNGGLGVNLTVPDTASFNWALGDMSQAANLISGNTGAGVGITMTGASVGNLIIENTTFSNTRVGTNPNYGGEGLNINEQGSAQLSGAIVQSNFTNNAGDGALITVTGNNVGIFSSLQNFIVGNLLNPTLGNSFNSNGKNGLEISRTADGEIGTLAVPIEIGNNTFNSNKSNGLVISAANKFNSDYYYINNNTMSLNGVAGNFARGTGDGLLFTEKADANIIANVYNNTITNNQNNGIQLTEQFNASSDLRGLSGQWAFNTITGNKGDGIDLNGATGNSITGSQLIIGSASDTSFYFANLIQNNGLNGVEVTNGGTLTIGDNMILTNGTIGNLFTQNVNAGVLMDLTMTNSLGTSVINVVNNNIHNNFGDGVQYQISTGVTGSLTQIIVDGNMITNNSGRGVNTVNRFNNFQEADISNNFISANGLEGVYAVNTASADQNLWSPSTTALLADGAITNRPEMLLHILGNQIIGNGVGTTQLGNGLLSALSGTGLVIRVGTSQGEIGAQGVATTDTGGFASSGATVVQGSSFATFLGAVTPAIGRSGVIAQVDNNTLGGNFGNDIMFDSFVSTGNPGAGAGTWDNTKFQVTGYTSNPLSRFDMYYRNNTTDAGSVDPVGVAQNGLLGNGFANRDPSLAAFYVSNDAVFKDRLNNIAAPNAPGPFSAANRAENATRQAARIPQFAAPVNFTDFNTFLYPGIGASTWRLSGDSSTAPFAGFIDATPYNDTNNWAGQFLGGPPGSGEMPFGYGQF